MASVDYPVAYRDFVEMFPSEEACLRYLEALAGRLRLPGLRSAGEPWRASRGRLVCRACRHEASVTAGTVFDKTRDAPHDLVRSCLACDHGQERHARPGGGHQACHRG